MEYELKLVIEILVKTVDDEFICDDIRYDCGGLELLENGKIIAEFYCDDLVSIKPYLWEIKKTRS